MTDTSPDFSGTLEKYLQTTGGVNLGQFVGAERIYSELMLKQSVLLSSRGVQTTAGGINYNQVSEVLQINEFKGSRGKLLFFKQTLKSWFWCQVKVSCRHVGL